VGLFGSTSATKPAGQANGQNGQAAKAIDPKGLQRQIQTACGHLVKKVLVTRTQDHGINVHIEVSGTPGSEKPVIDKVLQIPEMLMPGVKLDLKVGP
jgi:hypothetical protein